MSAKLLPFQAWMRSVAPLLVRSPPSSCPIGVTPCRRRSSSGSRDKEEEEAYEAHSRALFDRYIGQRYREPQRHYHTLTHVATMVKELDGFLHFSHTQQQLLQQDHENRLTSSASAKEEGTVYADISRFVVPTTDALKTQLHALSAQSDKPSVVTEDAVVLLVMDLAILFHDAVYEPTAKDNEEKSVALLREFLDVAKGAGGGCQGCEGGQRAGASEDEGGARKRPREADDQAESKRCSGSERGTPVACPAREGDLWRYPDLVAAVADEVERLILATTHHFAVPPMKKMTLPWHELPPLLRQGSRNTDDGKDSKTTEKQDSSTANNCYGYYQPGERVPTELLLLDLDLAILGSSTSTYTAYAGHIREEYSHFSDADFYQGRGQFLASAIGSLEDVAQPGVASRKEPMQLFKTPFFFHRFEAQAWRNMSGELADVEEARRKSLAGGGEEPG